MKSTITRAIFLVSLCLFLVQGKAQLLDFESFDDYVENAVKEHEVTGLSIAIVKDDKVVFSGAYGYADNAKKEEMESKYLFNIASCSKAFTAAAVTRLVHQGKLKWNDPVTNYIPDFALADECATNMTTIEDLLCHRTGLGTFYGDLLWYQTDYTPEEIIRRMKHLPMTTQYRVQFGYQNNMYLIAGEVIKAVTDTSWSDYIQANFFDKMGMEHSRTSSIFLEKGQHIAMPHLEGGIQEIYQFQPNPAASIYSSTDELTSWVRMLLNDGEVNGKQVVSKKVINDMFSSRIPLKVWPFHEQLGTHFRSYGLGWFLFDYAGKKVVEHDGGMPGYISKVALVPEEELGFIILTNDMNGVPDALRYRILDMFLGKKETDWAGQFLKFKEANEAHKEEQAKKRRDERKEGTKPTASINSYAGTYTDKMYGDAVIKQEGQNLSITLKPASKVFTSEMEHWHDDSWRIKFNDDFLPEGWVNFDLNDEGEVTGFKIDLPNPDFHFFNLDFVKN